MTPPNRFALLIGVGNYQDKNFKALPCALKDIDAMQEVLENKDLGNFKVTPLKNPTSQQVKYSIVNLFKNCKPDDVILIYYSGHGIKDNLNHFYLTTTDSNLQEISITAVSASFVHTEIARSSPKRLVIILDCCFSRAFIDKSLTDNFTVTDIEEISKSILGDSPIKGDFVESESKGEDKVRVILTSCEATQYSLPSRHSNLSAFTHYIITGIKTGDADLNKDSSIDVNELYNYVKDKLQEETNKMKPTIYLIGEGSKIKIAKVITYTQQLIELIKQCKNSDGHISEAGRVLIEYKSGKFGINREELERLLQELPENEVISSDNRSSASQDNLNKYAYKLFLEAKPTLSEKKKLRKYFQINSLQIYSTEAIVAYTSIVSVINNHPRLFFNIGVFTGLSILIPIGTIAFTNYRKVELQNGKQIEFIQQARNQGRHDDCINSASRISQNSSRYQEAQSLLLQCNILKSLKLDILDTQINTIRAIAISSKEEYLAFSDADKVLQIWDLNPLKRMPVFTERKDEFNSINFTSTGDAILAIKDENLKLLNLNKTEEIVLTKNEKITQINSIVISSDVKTLVSLSGGRTIRIFDLNTPKVRSTFNVNLTSVDSVAISPQAQILAIGGQGQDCKQSSNVSSETCMLPGVIELRNLQTGELLFTQPVHSQQINSIIISTDGSTLVSGSSDNKVSVWNIQTRKLKLLQILTEHSAAVATVAISPDGKTFASSSSNETILWDLKTRAKIQTLATQANSTQPTLMTSLVFAPNGKMLVGGGQDGKIRIWRW